MVCNEKLNYPVFRDFSVYWVFQMQYTGVPSFRGVPVFQGVPVFRCSRVFRGVPVFLVLVHAGKDNNVHSNGVALIANRQAVKSLMEWEPISNRLIRARFASSYCNLTILQCYASNKAEKDDNDNFYEQLQHEVSKTPQHDMLLLTRDLNAKVGNDNSGREDAMGQHGCKTRGEKGIIGRNVFPLRDIHKQRWRSPDGNIVNKIDHVINNKKWQRSLLDVKIHPGADVGSDHHLLIAKIRPKLRATPTIKRQLWSNFFL